jgi:hypothetical protein
VRDNQWLSKFGQTNINPPLPQAGNRRLWRAVVNRAVAAVTLSRAGMISYKRGTINILNRQHLEDTSCECYCIVKNEYARLLAILG